MAEEMESPTEQAQEDMHEHAHRAAEAWVGWVALTAAFLAALAAVTGLKAGDHANEALFEQVQASDKWNEYQAQKAKSLLKTEILSAMGKEPTEADRAKLDEREKKQEGLKEKATELETSAHQHMERHKTLAPGVTMFQIAIAMAAITVLSKRKPIWYVSLAFGLLGIYFLMRGTILFHPVPHVG
jgi:heme A synthase